MRKLFAIMALIMALVLTGCPVGDDGGGDNGGNKTDVPKTSVRIKNESLSWLMNVHLGDKYFEPTVQNAYGYEGLPGDPGYFTAGDISHKIVLTEDTSGYIYFALHIYAEGAVGARMCYTKDLVVVNTGEEVEFVFTNNTLVVDAGNVSNVRPLKDMEAYFKAEM